MTDEELYKSVMQNLEIVEELVYSEYCRKEETDLLKIDVERLFSRIKLKDALLEKQREELDQYYNLRRLWHRVCRFELNRQEKFYKMMFIDQKSDFAMYLDAIKQLAESEE